jgi:hypothetical protein
MSIVYVVVKYNEEELCVDFPSYMDGVQVLRVFKEESAAKKYVEGVLSDGFTSCDYFRTVMSEEVL